MHQAMSEYEVAKREASDLFSIRESEARVLDAVESEDGCEDREEKRAVRDDEGNEGVGEPSAFRTAEARCDD